jgi:hypothetical protein
MFKRNQVQEAIANVLEPGSAKASPEIRTRMTRLLETDRSFGRNRRSPDPDRAGFAFHSNWLGLRIGLPAGVCAF